MTSDPGQTTRPDTASNTTGGTSEAGSAPAGGAVPGGNGSVRLVLVTGLSGAGRTTCLKILEDGGFEAVDNLPTTLLERLIDTTGEASSRLAIGIDSRSRGVDPSGLARRWRKLARSFASRLVFLDCEGEVLRRRFTTTRRRHPFSDIADIASAIDKERQFMAPLKEAADLVIDTSELSIPELRRLLSGHLVGPGDQLLVSVVSFSFKLGPPREADLVFDVRFLNNPYYDEQLRPLTGNDAAVRAFIAADPGYARFMSDLEQLLAPLLPRYRSEGKSYLTIAIGCTGGRHRSVVTANELGHWLAGQGWDTTIRHRDLPAGMTGEENTAASAGATP